MCYACHIGKWYILERLAYVKRVFVSYSMVNYTYMSLY